MGEWPAAVRPLSAVSYVPSAALLCRRAALGDGLRRDDAGGRGRRPRLAAGRGGLAGPLRAARCRRPRAPDGARRTGCAAGRSTAPARRCWPPGTGSAVAPVVLAPSSALVWILAVAGGRYGRMAALGVLGWTTARLARRLGRPGEPPPVAAAAGLVLRGTLAAGRSLTRAATRHWWPVAARRGGGFPPGPPMGLLARRRRRGRGPGGRTGTRRRRCGSSPPGGSRTSATAPGCGGAHSGTGSPARCSLRGRPGWNDLLTSAALSPEYVRFGQRRPRDS